MAHSWGHLHRHLTHKKNGREEDTEKRPAVQVSHNPMLPTTSPVPSFPSSQDKSWTKAGSLPLADISSATMILIARWLLWLKFPTSAILLTLFTHWVSQFLCWGYYRVCCFTSNFKVWECVFLQVPSQSRACESGECLPTGRCGPLGTAAAQPQTQQGSPGFSLNVTHSQQTPCQFLRLPVAEHLSKMNLGGRERLGDSILGLTITISGSVCRYNSRFWVPFLSDPAKHWNMTLLPLPLRTSP